MTNNELDMMRISYLVPIMEALIGGCCFFLLAKSFMQSKKGAASVGAVYFLSMRVLYIIPVQFINFAAYSLGVFVAFVVMCLLERRNYGQKVFITVVFFSLHWFAYAMTDILRDKTYDAILRTHYMAVHQDQWFAVYAIMCLFWLALYFVFMAVSVRCISKKCAYKYIDLSIRELLILIAPSIMGVLGFESMWYYRASYYRISYIAENGKFSDIYDLLVIFYCVAAIAVIVVVIVLYQGIKAQQEEKVQNGLLAAQIDSIKQHMEQMENLYQNIHSIRHDMTNHILTLERLYTGNKAEEAKAYTIELKAALAEMTGNINSGNPVADVILQEMQSGAAKRKIRFETDFHYPIDSGVNAFDISVILNNALQNALENSEKSKEPYIFIRSYCRKNAYMIEIRNSFTGSLQWDAESELPITSKQKLDGHGYGVANIRKVARKYSGDIDIALKNGEFCISIMLMLE